MNYESNIWAYVKYMGVITITAAGILAAMLSYRACQNDRIERLQIRIINMRLIQIHEDTRYIIDHRDKLKGGL